MAIKVLPVRNATYFGRRAQVKEIRQAGAHGVREIRMHWIDDADPKNGGYPAGTITSKTIKGNALTGTLVTLVPVHVITEF